MLDGTNVGVSYVKSCVGYKGLYVVDKCVFLVNFKFLCVKYIFLLSGFVSPVIILLTTGTGGDIGLYISDKHGFVRRKDLELPKIESIRIEIRIKKSKNILFCTKYRPPDSSLHLTGNFANIFSNMLSMATKENTEIILMGDLNINYFNNTDHREIKYIFLLHGLTQTIKSPTRYDLHHNSSSLIDIIFVKETLRIAKSEVLPMSISDHDMIGCVYKINSIKFNGRTIRCRDYRNYNPEQLQKDIRESN